MGMSEGTSVRPASFLLKALNAAPWVYSTCISIRNRNASLLPTISAELSPNPDSKLQNDQLSSSHMILSSRLWTVNCCEMHYTQLLHDHVMEVKGNSCDGIKRINNSLLIELSNSPG